MSRDPLIVGLLVAVFLMLLVLWWYLRMHRRRLNHLHEKADQMLASQEGGRMQISSQGDEIRHQQSRLMERVQFLMLRLDYWWKNRDKDNPPP